MKVEDYSEESNTEKLLIDQEIIDLTKTLEFEGTSDAEDNEMNKVTQGEALKARYCMSEYIGVQ